MFIFASNMYNRDYQSTRSVGVFSLHFEKLMSEAFSFSNPTFRKEQQQSFGFNYLYNPGFDYRRGVYPQLSFNFSQPDFTIPVESYDKKQTEQSEDVSIKTQSAIELARKISKENKVDENKILEVINLACKTAKKYGVDEKLVLAVIYQESRFKNNLTSSAGAKGYMQLMPGTAAGLGVKNSMDPEQNIDGGVRLLKKLLDRYDGNITATLAAYNAGPGHVDDVINGTNKHGKNKSLRKDSDGIPNIRETKNYVANITGNYKNFSVA